MTLDASGYTAPRVLLEFGGRGDHWPEADREIVSYAAEAVGGPRGRKEPALVRHDRFQEVVTIHGTR